MKRFIVKLKTGSLVILVGILVVLLYPYYLSYVEIRDNQINSMTLKTHEKEKILIKGREVTIVTEKGVKRLRGVRKSVIIFKDDGTYTKQFKIKGLCFEPGMTGFYSQESFHIGVDVQWAYWKTFGLASGVGMSTDGENNLGVYSSVYYNFISNSSIGIGLDLQLDPVINLRVRF